MKVKLGYIFLILSGVGFIGFIQSFSTNDGIEPYVLSIPKGFPQPQIPAENQLTVERIELGRRLFYDPVLSRDSSISCAHCHQQELAFSDTNAITPGVDQRLAMRNAPTLTNVGFNPTYLYDGNLPTLEMQILVPIQEHAEFDFNIVEVSKRLKRIPEYVKMSANAYNRPPDSYVITRAISSFERTLISGNSRYDRYKNGKKNELSRSEKRGMDLFFNQLYCASCHGGFNFTDFSTKNNGLYTVYADSGRARVTSLPEDRAMFKVPTLRNIELTAPYMHDGSFATLEAVIDHYMSGGISHENKSDLIKPFQLTEKQKADLIAFLKSLTDHEFITNPAFSNPFN